MSQQRQESQQSVEDMYNKFMDKVQKRKQSTGRQTTSQSTIRTSITPSKRNSQNLQQQQETQHGRQFSFHKQQQFQNNSHINLDSHYLPQSHNNQNQNSNNVRFQDISPLEKRQYNKSIGAIANTASFSPINREIQQQNFSPPPQKLSNNQFTASNRSFVSGGASFINNWIGQSPKNQGLSQQQQQGQQRSISPNMKQQSSIQQNVSQFSQMGFASSRAFANAMNALQERVKQLEAQQEEERQKSMYVVQDYEQELELKQKDYNYELQNIKEVEQTLHQKVASLEKLVEGISQENKNLIIDNSGMSQKIVEQSQNYGNLEEQIEQITNKYEKQLEIQKEELDYMRQWKEEQKELYDEIVAEGEKQSAENSQNLLIINQKNEELIIYQDQIKNLEEEIKIKDSQLSDERVRNEQINKEIYQVRGQYNTQLKDFQAELLTIETTYKKRIEQLEQNRNELIEQNRKGCELLEKREFEYNNLEQKYFKKTEQFQKLKKELQSLKPKCNACGQQKKSGSKAQSGMILSQQSEKSFSKKKLNVSNNLNHSVTPTKDNTPNNIFNQNTQQNNTMITESDDTNLPNFRFQNKSDEKPNNQIQKHLRGNSYSGNKNSVYLQQQSQLNQFSQSQKIKQEDKNTKENFKQEYIDTKQKILNQTIQKQIQDNHQFQELDINKSQKQYEQIQQRYQEQMQIQQNFQNPPLFSNQSGQNFFINKGNNQNSFMQMNDLQNINDENGTNSLQQQYEVILKLIIETEKGAMELNKSYQNLLTESQGISEAKKKAEYRGRLIELNEQIKKNNDKLYVLKKKEHIITGQLYSQNNSMMQQ